MFCKLKHVNRWENKNRRNHEIPLVSVYLKHCMCIFLRERTKIEYETIRNINFTTREINDLWTFCFILSNIPVFASASYLMSKKINYAIKYSTSWENTWYDYDLFLFFGHGKTSGDKCQVRSQDTSQDVTPTLCYILASLYFHLSR